MFPNALVTSSPTSNGCPEGDSWSVVAMLVTAETWCYLLEQQTPLPRMSAYADNWSVWTGDIHISAAPALCTSRFVDWMGLQISWDKTWIWSTSTSGAAKLKACMTEHFPATATTIKTSATDLGCQLTYHGNSKLGIVHQRFEQAKMRLEVIKQSNWALPHKSHVVQTAILPLALYGTELMPVGQKNLTSLRTAIVEAIVGEHIQTMSSAIFIQCVENCDLDPFFRAILVRSSKPEDFCEAHVLTTETVFWLLFQNQVCMQDMRKDLPVLCVNICRDLHSHVRPQEILWSLH